MNIIKRNGEEVAYNGEKIVSAVTKANNSVPASTQMSELEMKLIEQRVRKILDSYNRAAGVEDIQDLVVAEIGRLGYFVVQKAYTEYRYKRMLNRKANTTDENILSLVEYKNEDVKEENSNKDPMSVSVQRDYVAGEVSRDLTERILLPEEVVDAHKKGIIHFHDSDYYVQHMYNCCLVNLEDMLQNGTVISGTMIEKPKSFYTACNVATQCIAQIASSQYGGQSITLAHLAPFVDISRQKFRKEVRENFKKAGIEATEEQINAVAEEQTLKEIEHGMQTIQYQVTTLMTTNGQAPFITVFMYIDEVPEGRVREDLVLIIKEMLRQRIIGTKNENGVYITPAFPKLIYVLDEDNVTEGTRYWDITVLAAQCTAKRMVPDYISAKVMKEYKQGDVYACMGCRSFLTPDRFTPEGQPKKYYGRFNQGVVTVNLVDVACSSGKDMEKFWEILDERLELCHRALRCRHERLLGTTSDVAPILWQHGAIARLKKGEKIDRLLYGGYSTISLGYAGLYEMCKHMTGKSHTDPEAKDFALSVMQRLNDKCAEWKKAEDIDYSVYGTPIESTTYKFAKALQKRFGVIQDVTDHNYITNSYHVNVREQIDAFTKLKFESEFQRLSPGGAISYVEVPNMQNNIDAVLTLMKFIYDNIMYAELNTKSDFCQVCCFDGEMVIAEDEHRKLFWKCPNCGNTDEHKLNVARRTCGYIGTNFWNQGRTQEIKERVLHL